MALVDDLKSELASVQAAITKAEQAQAYEIGSPSGNHRTVRAQLETLYDERRRLRAQIAKVSRRGIRGRYGIPF